MGVSLDRFKRFVVFVSGVNRDIDNGKVSVDAARRIVRERSMDSAGRQFVVCNEVVSNGKVHFEIPKRYVEMYTLK